MLTSAGGIRQDIGTLPGNDFVKDGHMQDADHFLKALFKALDAEIGCEDNRNTINHTPVCFIRSMEGKESYDHRFTNSEDGSCSICGYKLRKSEENFRVLHLLNRSLKAASIQELLNENLDQPSNKFQYKCRCGVMQDVEDWRSISEIPEVLLLNVEKFEAETKSGVTDEYLLLNGVQYQLTAVMDHIGRRRDGGHWITWSRCPEVRSGWIRCDDDCIEEVDLEKVFSRSNHTFAYVKFPPVPTFAELEPISTVCITPEADFEEVETVSPMNITPEHDFEEVETVSPMNITPEYDYEEVETTSSVLTDKCLTCGKTFKRLITHLKKSIECQTSYDMEALEDFQNTKRKEQRKEDKRRSRQNQTPQKKAEETVKNSEEKKIFRGNQTPEEKAEDKMKSKARMKRFRGNQTPDEKAKDRMKNTEGKKKFRENQTSEEKAEEKVKDTEGKKRRQSKRTHEEIEDDRIKNRADVKRFREAMSQDELERAREKNREAHEVRRRKLQNDRAYKKSLAVYQADYRKRVFKKNNESVFGRRRVFIESVRDGPRFPCIVCHRMLFNISVIQINLEKFREDLNAVEENDFFEKVVYVRIPSSKKKHYICVTCKGYLFRGKMPPMAAVNNLEVYDNKQTPELQLTELEGSMIAKNLFFLKIFKLPRSDMSAIKSKCVCIPIGEEDIQNTLSMLPRTPNQAGLVPVKLKRMQKWKHVHLQEYIDVEKLLKALKLLRDLGHPHYQFQFEKSIQGYKQRCLIEDKEGYDIMYQESDDEMSNSDTSDKAADLDKDVEIGVDQDKDFEEEADQDKDFEEDTDQEKDFEEDADQDKDFEEDTNQDKDFEEEAVQSENFEKESIGEDTIEKAEKKLEKSFEKDQDRSKTITEEIIEKEASEDVKQAKTRAEEIGEEIIEKEADEEYYLKHDCVGRFQFNYNHTTAMNHDQPEMNVQDAPIIISPGEGRYHN